MQTLMHPEPGSKDIYVGPGNQRDECRQWESGSTSAGLLQTSNFRRPIISIVMS